MSQFKEVFMPLLTVWQPERNYQPNDKRLNLIYQMINSLLYFPSFTGDSYHPSTTQIGGSTAWAWMLQATFPQSRPWINYYLHNIDIDLRNFAQGDKYNFGKEKSALLKFADLYYKGFYNSPEPFSETDYAQVTFLFNPSIDWTISKVAKAPLHNYDIFCTLEAGPKPIRFHVPVFTGAEDARKKYEFLLNPAIFKIESGVPIFNQAQYEEDGNATKDINLNKNLAWVIKTICKMSMSGIKIAEPTLQYLTALASSNVTANTNIRPLSTITNGTILQSVLVSFYHVYYKRAHPDDKYIFETALKSIKINVADSEKTLYEIFAKAVHQEIFSYENAQVAHNRVTTHLYEITPYLFRLIPKPATAPMSPVPPAVAKENMALNNPPTIGTYPELGRAPLPIKTMPSPNSN